MDKNELAASLLKLAEAMGEPEEEEVPVEASMRQAKLMAYNIRLKLAAKKDPRVVITALPGMTPASTREKINRIVEVRHELEIVRKQYEAVLEKLAGLSADEKAGVAELRKAAEQMAVKDKYLVEAEHGLLEFTAYLKEISPGPEQIIQTPEEAKEGERAGGFFLKVGEKLGEQIEASVREIWEAVKKDITYADNQVTALKVVAKTSTVTASELRKAGVDDIVLAVREWLTGVADDVAQRIFGFSGTLSKWVKGFFVRSDMVKNSHDDLLDAIENGIEDLNKLAEKYG